MNDPRAAARAVFARWLRVRAEVRALEDALTAHEHRLRRDAPRNRDAAETAQLAAQLRTERAALAALGGELDERIAAVKRDFAAIEAGYIDALVDRARRRDPA